jgi:hypothetical protein
MKVWECARAANVSERTIYRWLLDRKFRAKKIAGAHDIDETSFARFLTLLKTDMKTENPRENVHVQSGKSGDTLSHGGEPEYILGLGHADATIVLKRDSKFLDELPAPLSLSEIKSRFGGGRFDALIYSNGKLVEQRHFQIEGMSKIEKRFAERELLEEDTNARRHRVNDQSDMRDLKAIELIIQQQTKFNEQMAQVNDQRLRDEREWQQRSLTFAEQQKSKSSLEQITETLEGLKAFKDIAADLVPQKEGEPWWAAALMQGLNTLPSAIASIASMRSLTGQMGNPSSLVGKGLETASLPGANQMQSQNINPEMARQAGQAEMRRQFLDIFEKCYLVNDAVGLADLWLGERLYLLLPKEDLKVLMRGDDASLTAWLQAQGISTDEGILSFIRTFRDVLTRPGDEA